MAIRNRHWFRIIFYGSLVFLIIALIRADYLVIPAIQRPINLVVSLILLFLGFYLNAFSWTRMVQVGGYRVSRREGIRSSGLSVFAKYIPGKVWVIMGRSEYLARKYRWSRRDLGSLSLDAQFIALWVALLIGAAGMILLRKTDLFGLSVVILFLLLSLMIFTPLFQKVAGQLLGKIMKKPVSLPKLTFSETIRVIPWYAANWGLWCIAFFFLASGLTNHMPEIHIATSFGLAGSLGIIAVFAPGGLGVREGILTGYLTMAGMDLPMATTIAVSSRLWFLLGEVFIFLLAASLYRKDPA